MRRMFRSMPLLIAFLCVSGAESWAQTASAPRDLRAPVFKLASATNHSPVRVEPGRVAVLQRTITLRLDDVPLEAALEAISALSGLPLVYSGGVVPVRRRVSLAADGITVAAALMEVLRGANVDVVINGNQAALVRRPAEPAGQEPGVIVGRVAEVETNSPIANARVLVDGAGQAFTDAQGIFRIVNVPPGLRTVTVMLIGYETVTREVEVPDGGVVTESFALEVRPTPLAEVVVTATGEQRRVELGNDITVIRADSIMAREPVASVTELLEGRVPGLIVQRTSGAPGDPARLRLRGSSSPNLSNDPIIVVDGIRVYSEQSAPRGASLAGGSTLTQSVGMDTLPYATPSPLDYIDPNTIETIQVFKGPSAATLYGQDAANGVIVITTKRGHDGPARWSIRTEYGQTQLPGDYPTLLVRWGHQLSDGRPVLCPVNNFADGNYTRHRACQADSVTTFQMLNDPDLTVLDRGHNKGVTVGVAGGSSTFTYSLTGSYRDQTGYIKLPDYEVERYTEQHGTAPPDWMRRPQNLEQWSGSGRIGARLGANANVSLTTTLSRSEQQRSSLERQLRTLMASVPNPIEGTYYTEARGSSSGDPLRLREYDRALTGYYERATAAETNFTNGVTLRWQPSSWLGTTATIGLNVVQRADEVFLPPGVDFIQRVQDANSPPDPGEPEVDDGRLRRGKGTSIVSTMKLGADVRAPLGRGFNLQLATGVEYTGRSVDDVRVQAEGIPEGTESINGAAEVRNWSENRRDRATFGLYVAPRIQYSRFYLSTGIRLEGGSTFGTRQTLPRFPKVDLSYLLSEEPFFPDALRSIIGHLRLRAAYGHAGRQPGPADRLRLYGQRESQWVEGEFGDAVFLETLGNTQLKPERAKEFEAGVDADLLDDRLSVSFTGFRKTTEDAMLDVPVAPSVYGPGFSVLKNIGVVRNSGFELTLNVEPVRSALATWSVNFNMARTRSLVVELGPGIEPFDTEITSGDSRIRVVPGYPLRGRWTKPVIGYADANGNGFLEREEVLFGDTMVYVGSTQPDFEASLYSTLSLLRGALSVSAGMLYTDGLTQRNEVAHRIALFSRGWNDPSAPLAEQVPILDRGEYTWTETVNSLRLNSLSVRYQLPSRFAAWLGAQAMSVSVHGSNLGLWTNYRGLDPNVNARTTGDGVSDAGVLPTPRSWLVRLNASY